MVLVPCEIGQIDKEQVLRPDMISQLYFEKRMHIARILFDLSNKKKSTK
jgi:hypothetical protein